MDSSLKEWFLSTAKTIKLKAQGRSIVCWGHDEEVIKELGSAGVTITDFFTGSSTLIREKGWKSFKELNNSYDKYFVILPNGFRVKESIKTLESYGFTPNDYFNVSMVPKRIKGPIDVYSDKWNNKINGLPEGASIFLGGNNNKIELGSNVRVDDEFEIICTSQDNVISIGNEVSFKGEKTKIHVLGKQGGVYVNIGNQCSFNTIKMDIGQNSYCVIGNHSTFANNTKFSMSSNSRLEVGEDCMFSMDIIVQPADGHSIFDLTTGKNINSDKNDFIGGYVKGIKFGNHVWVGKRSFILGGTSIEDGCVIGAQSTVKGHFPNNVVLAGNPAKIRRTNIAWARHFQADDTEKCNGYTKLTKTD